MYRNEKMMYGLSIRCNNMNEFNDIQRLFFRFGYIWRSGEGEIQVENETNFPVVIQSDASGVKGRLVYSMLKKSLMDGDDIISAKKFLRKEKLERLSSISRNKLYRLNSLYNS